MHLAFVLTSARYQALTYWRTDPAGVLWCAFLSRGCLKSLKQALAVRISRSPFLGLHSC